MLIVVMCGIFYANYSSLIPIMKYIFKQIIGDMKSSDNVGT